MLTALLGIAKDLRQILIDPVQFLGNLLPLSYLVSIGSLPGRALQTYQSLLDYSRKQIRLLSGPIVSGEGDFLDAEPLEHAGFCIHTGDQGGDVFPVLSSLNETKGTRSFSRSVMPRRSAYLETTQMRIFRSSSPQLRFSLFVFSILHRGMRTFQCGSLSSSAIPPPECRPPDTCLVSFLLSNRPGRLLLLLFPRVLRSSLRNF